MQQYNVDFFNRGMSFAYNSTIDVTSIDDDYISSSVNVIEIPPTLLVTTGQFVRLQNDDYSFFGLVTDVSPGEYETNVSYKSFLTIFDEEVLFDTLWQGTTEPSSRPTLEGVIYSYLTDNYISTSDVLERLPISVSIDPSITQTTKWSFGYASDSDETHRTVVNLYSDIIVRALKDYGIVIDVNPVFHDGTVHLVITKRSVPLKISADLDNITVKTLKYSESNIGTNKLIVYNANNFNQSLIFYVHTDHSWSAEDRDRITPVIRAIKTVTPQENTTNSFIEAATEAAYSALSSSAWDNCIELEVYVDDINVTPMQLSIGQTVDVRYQGASYTSILTGRIMDGNKITLVFGSDRIQYSKRFKINGGK